MDKVSVTLRVFFEDPFWVGLIERVSEGKMAVCKVTFGAEPKEYEVECFLLENYFKLRFGPALCLSDGIAVERRINPKRAQKEAAKLLKNTEPGTKSQQALKLLREQGKTEKKIRSRLEKETLEERQFWLRRQKRKEKHRGH